METGRSVLAPTPPPNGISIADPSTSSARSTAPVVINPACDPPRPATSRNARPPRDNARAAAAAEQDRAADEHQRRRHEHVPREPLDAEQLEQPPDPDDDHHDPEHQP